MTVEELGRVFWKVGVVLHKLLSTGADEERKVLLRLEEKVNSKTWPRRVDVNK
jgi:hypothetical protein